MAGKFQASLMWGLLKMLMLLPDVTRCVHAHFLGQHSKLPCLLLLINIQVQFSVSPVCRYGDPQACRALSFKWVMQRTMAAAEGSWSFNVKGQWAQTSLIFSEKSGFDYGIYLIRYAEFFTVLIVVWKLSCLLSNLRVYHTKIVRFVPHIIKYIVFGTTFMYSYCHCFCSHHWASADHARF